MPLGSDYTIYRQPVEVTVVLPLGSDYVIYRQLVGVTVVLPLGSDYIIYPQPVEVTLVIATGLRLHHLPSTSRGDSCYCHRAQTTSSIVNQYG